MTDLTIDVPATAEHLLVTRKRLGWSQTEMAFHLGIKLRAYQDIENGVSAVRQRDVAAAEFAALRVAVIRGDPRLAGNYGATLARRFAEVGGAT